MLTFYNLFTLCAVSTRVIINGP